MSPSHSAFLAAVMVGMLSLGCSTQAHYQKSQASTMGEDIILTREQEELLAQQYYHDPFAPQGAVVRNARQLWRGGVLPFALDHSLNRRARRAIQEAMAVFQRRTCISFRERTNEWSYVRFIRGSGCSSHVGQIGGVQDISIGSGCEHTRIVIHEILHALGRWHEQSRPDRDRYVQILFQNIEEGTEHNFRKVTNSLTNGIPYDYYSIMHYGSHDFSRNGRPTIVPWDRSVDTRRMGNVPTFSARDVQHVNTLYTCQNSPVNTGTWSIWSSWSDCSEPCNGGVRSKMRTCLGGTGCVGANFQEEKCNMNVCPNGIPTWTMWTSWSTCSRSCGGGMQHRTRHCVGGEACPGSDIHFTKCNLDSCNPLAVWSEWSGWTKCTKTCTGGGRLRTRVCINNQSGAVISSSECVGENQMVQSCNHGVPCHTIPSTSIKWSSQSRCGRKCGSGVSTRAKETSNSQRKQENCNMQTCAIEGNNTGLQHLGCFYHQPKYSILMPIEALTKELLGPYRTRPYPIISCGRGALKFNYTIFGLVGKICLTGSHHMEDYMQFNTSNTCHNGVGSIDTVEAWEDTGFGYIKSRVYSMDLYQVTDMEQFRISVTKIIEDNRVRHSSGEKAKSAANIHPSSPKSLIALMLLITVRALHQ